MPAMRHTCFEPAPGSRPGFLAVGRPVSPQLWQAMQRGVGEAQLRTPPTFAEQYDVKG
jgi:hypothetical protein